jgi:hypothetical protein
MRTGFGAFAFQFDSSEFPCSARFFDAVVQSQRLLLALGGLRSAQPFS